ncbi:MAG: DegT/DnrJ/EryC1/StrS family aminotransferase [Roseomonas sp.]|jgi:dTDP-4-amino-4,6-dideoxygalactose transaminase|nr:DegT/DnrJ/EryC1/StrS family aminotransferase [Roseomonas sp.]MCA3341819.1 DegT/DnrJ/EryC1/StrS family aminotransferase [Roseomonas sp.]
MTAQGSISTAGADLDTNNGPTTVAPLYVSQPLLPDQTALNVYIEKIWASKYVTNHGPFSLELEDRLAALLHVPTAKLFNNATIGLLVALKLFELPPGSEVITTPMTFAATAHSIAWNNLRPVFVDIKEDDLTIDPDAVEMAISPRTSAILAVHVYGCICDHDALQRLADLHRLKLIYDAAHAFGAYWNGRPVASLGHASVFSFHATKLFNTLEGGLVTTNRLEDRERIYLLRNFGIKNEEEVVSVGINGKMNELQAAVGLLNLDLFEGEREKRKGLRQRYREILGGLDGVLLQEVTENVTQSEQYLLVRIDQDKSRLNRDELKERLAEKQIFARKYFYPICTDYEPYRNMPIISARARPYAQVAKHEVLCLPFHSGVTEAHLDLIAAVFQAC